MSFYMAMPSTGYGFIKTSGKRLWSQGRVEAWENGGRLYMFNGQYMVGELIYGRKGLDKYYKGSFEVWRDKIKAKDFEKCDKMRSEASFVIDQCESIESMWRTTED